jgi:hypothetical protein
MMKLFFFASRLLPCHHLRIAWFCLVCQGLWNKKTKKLLVANQARRKMLQ